MNNINIELSIEALEVLTEKLRKKEQIPLAIYVSAACAVGHIIHESGREKEINKFVRVLVNL